MYSQITISLKSDVIDFANGKSALCNFIIEDSKLAVRMSEQVKIYSCS